MQHFGVNSFDALMALFGRGGAYEGNTGWYDILRTAQDGDRITAYLPDMQTSVTGNFTRNDAGRIQIDMGGGQVVDENVFAVFGGHRTGMTYKGRSSEYGMYYLQGVSGARWAASTSGTQATADIPCNTWDCVALALDATSTSATIFRDSSFLSTPITGPFGFMGATYGEAIATSADVAGLGRTTQQWMDGKASNIDLAVSTTLFYASRAPGLGTCASLGQLTYDLASPFLPW